MFVLYNVRTKKTHTHTVAFVCNMASMSAMTTENTVSWFGVKIGNVIVVEIKKAFKIKQ